MPDMEERLSDVASTLARARVLLLVKRFYEKNADKRRDIETQRKLLLQLLQEAEGRFLHFVQELTKLDPDTDF